MTLPTPRFTVGAWTRAARIACSAPDAAEALAGLLEEAVPALGALGGAVLEGAEVVCRSVWGVDAAALQPLLEPGGAVRRGAAEAEAAQEAARRLRRAEDPSWLDGVEEILVLPLRVRGVPVGAMALLFAPGAAPSDRVVADLALGFAAVAALVLEGDRLYEEAREAHQARDHFLTALNHELRTPATAFVLTADLLASEPPSTLPAHVQRLLRDADAHLQQLLGVLRRVLDLGRLGDHANPERSELLRPRDLVADLMRRVEPTAKRKSLSLALYVPRNLPPLQSDGERVARILLHLLSNAIKYTAHGRVEVRLERTAHVLSRARPEPVLVVQVRDSGRGIPAGELERIFEPFAQVDEGARSDSVTRGQGLGLPLARRLARSLGGDVRLESQVGAGTTATLILPYHQSTPQQA